MSEPPAIAITVNGERRQVPAGTTVGGLLELLGLRPEVVAVEIIRALVPRATRGERPLCDGDAVELVTLVGGG